MFFYTSAERKFMYKRLLTKHNYFHATITNKIFNLNSVSKLMTQTFTTVSIS